MRKLAIPNNNKSRFLLMLLAFFPIYFYMNCTSGFFKYNYVAYFSILSKLSLSIWFLGAYLYKPKLIKDSLKVILPFLICVLFLSVFLFIRDDFTVPYHIKWTIQLASIFLISGFYLDEENEKERKILLGLIFADIALSAIYTIAMNYIYPDVSRYIHNSTIEKVYGRKSFFSGISVYSTIYAEVFLVPTLLFLCLSKKNREKAKIKVVYGCLSFILLFLSYKTDFLLALMLSLFGSVLIIAFLLIKSLPDKKKKVVIGALAALVLAGIIFIKPIVAFFTSGTLLPDFITNRMKSILALLNGEGTVGDIGARLYYYRFSILSLKNSKLIGSYILNSSPPGGHMAIIDLLAQCGLVVFTIYLFTTVRICRRVSENLGKDEKTVFILTWALYIFFGLINNIFFAPMFIIMVLVLPNAMLETVHRKEIE